MVRHRAGWIETGVDRRVLDEPALWPRHKALGQKGLRIVASRGDGSVPLTFADRHNLVARLLHEGRDSVYSRAFEVRRTKELGPISKRSSYFQRSGEIKYIIPKNTGIIYLTSIRE